MRLEGFRCYIHGDVFARDAKFGPCPKCNAEDAADKVAAAKLRIREIAVKRLKQGAARSAKEVEVYAELEYQRSLIIGGHTGMTDVQYWEGFVRFFEGL